MAALENLFGTNEAAFASNLNGRIVDWNESAERLLGHASSDVIGRQCFEVLDGKDIFGNRFCHEKCAIRSMIRRHEPLNHWQLNYRTASSERINVSVSAVLVNGNKPSDYVVMHVLNPLANLDKESRLGIPDKHGNRFLLDEPAEEGSCPMELTAREFEVLRLLAAGSTTQEIACRLCIRKETVRTHIGSILHKLNVHSRLEAVCLAISCRLL